MNIHGAGSSSAALLAAGAALRHGTAAQDKKDVAPPQTPPVVPPAPAPEDQPPSGQVQGPETDDGSAKGVIRLLEEGHFKGVADVRLRINFFDQLSTRATAVSTQNTQQSAGGLADTVNSQVDSLVNSLGLDDVTRSSIDGLFAGFKDSAQTALDAFSKQGSPDTQTLSDALQSAFDTFIEQLRTALTPAPAPVSENAPTDPIPPETTGSAETPASSETPAPTDGSTSSETPVPTDGSTPAETPPTSDAPAPTNTSATPETPASVETPASAETPPATDANSTTDPTATLVTQLATETTTEPTINLDELLAPLIQSFSQSLADLQAASNPLTLLPDPSPPQGNGGAYAKFLAIYNDLRGVNIPDSTTTEQPVDVVA